MALPSDPSVTTLFGGAMLLVGSIALAVSGRYVWRATAVFRATDRDILGDVAPGTLVRASGTVVRGDEDALVAPFSGTECVALRYRVEERRPNFLYIIPWYVTVHEATAAVEFSLRTATGTVPVVEPARTVVLTEETVETTSAGTEPPERIQQFERDHEQIPTSTVWQRPPAFLAPLFRMLSLGTRRYSEQRAARGAEVTAVGRVSDGRSGIDPVVVSDRPPGATVFRMAKTSVAGLLIGIVGLLLGSVLLVLG